MRQLILSFDPELSEAWKYRMPFFCLGTKMFCYLWTDRKTGQPYIGFVDGKKLNHPALISGTRARMKIFMLDPEKDLPVKTLKGFLRTLAHDASAR